jgi:hypothetical protein
LIDGLDQMVALFVDHFQRGGDGVEGFVDDRLLSCELACQAVEAVGGCDDVVGLFVDSAGEHVELRQQAAHIAFAAPEGGGQCPGDVLDAPESTTVEQ